MGFVGEFRGCFLRTSYKIRIYLIGLRIWGVEIGHLAIEKIGGNCCKALPGKELGEQWEN